MTLNYKDVKYVIFRYGICAKAGSRFQSIELRVELEKRSVHFTSVLIKFV